MAKIKQAPNDVQAAMKWFQHQSDIGSKAWGGLCLKSCRTALGLQPIGSSAKELTIRMRSNGRMLHRIKNPMDEAEFEDIPRGALLLSSGGTYGHAWMTSKTTSWSVDYAGPHGTIKHAPRHLPKWSTIRKATEFWVCGIVDNYGKDWWIKGIDCPFPKCADLGRHA